MKTFYLAGNIGYVNYAPHEHESLVTAETIVSSYAARFNGDGNKEEIASIEALEDDYAVVTEPPSREEYQICFKIETPDSWSTGLIEEILGGKEAPVDVVVFSTVWADVVAM